MITLRKFIHTIKNSIKKRPQDAMLTTVGALTGLYCIVSFLVSEYGNLSDEEKEKLEKSAVVMEALGMITSIGTGAYNLTLEYLNSRRGNAELGTGGNSEHPCDCVLTNYKTSSKPPPYEMEQTASEALITQLNGEKKNPEIKV